MSHPAFLSSALSLTCCILIGCGQTIVVKRSAYATDPHELNGIPFYVKNAACKHQTIWLQPVYVLTLKVTFTPEKGTSGSEPQSSTRIVILTLNEYQTKPVSELYRAVSAGKTGSNTPTDDIKQIEDAWAAVQALSPADPYRLDESQLDPQNGTDRGRVMMVANEALPEVYVDYSTMYYYNTRKPLAGSSQASIKLAADGTMTEGTGQQESKTLQTFVDLLPVKEVLSALAKGALPVLGIEAAPIKVTAKYELSTDVKVWKHTHYLFDATKPPCTPPQSRLTSLPYHLVVEDVSEAKKASPKDNEISVSGSIQLPKKDQSQTDKKP